MKAIKFLLIALAVASCSPEDAIVLGCDPENQNCRTVLDKDILPQGTFEDFPLSRVYTLTLENNCDGSVEVWYTFSRDRWFHISAGENNCSVIRDTYFYFRLY